jgi:FKBP-type peptidyl-prolyl cis-trans isomerase
MAVCGALARADDAPKAAMPDQAQPAAVSSFTDNQKIEEVGWIVAKKSQLADLKLSPEEIASLVKGFSAAMDGKPAPYELVKIGPEIDTLMQKKQTAYLTELKQKSAVQNSEFFAKLKDNKNVVESPSGLRYEIVSPGQGPFPKASDTVRVNYTGALIDGTVFDSSVNSGQPAEFPLSGVIPGWTEGIQKINKGGKIKLYVPPTLGYGDEGRTGIPPGSTLIFDVELLDINPAPPPSAAPSAPPSGG